MAFNSKRNKIYSNNPEHMTNMAVEIVKIFLSKTKWSLALKLCMLHQVSGTTSMLKDDFELFYDTVKYGKC